MDISTLWNRVLSQAPEGSIDVRLLRAIRESALHGRSSADIAFGTSGWRGIIGDDFTVFNVQKVTQAIVDMYRYDAKELREYLGVGSYREFQSKGVLLGHDTRFLGREFAEAVGALLNREGVRTGYAGITTTPELSASVVSGNFACSLNLTPSHNPGNYGGFKFNPADGGPAGKEITGRIEERLNGLKGFSPCNRAGAKWDAYDVLRAYTGFVQSRDFVDLEFCRKFSHSGRVALAVDSMHGATGGRTARILSNPKACQALRSDHGAFFRGLAPEPSAENIILLREYLDGRPEALKLGAIMDPDGDRVRFYDGESDLDMNRFAVIAFHYLAAKRGREGGAAKTVATSDFIKPVAKKLGRDVYETPVGFKHFRPHLLPGTPCPAAVCFEESDGISGYGNTLEKDAHAGFLLGLEIMGKTGKSLTSYLRDLQAEFGTFYPLRFNFSVERSQMGNPLRNVMAALQKKYLPGGCLQVGDSRRKVAEVITLDGLKLTFEDNSWLLIRPSGTEPKVRVFSESQSESDAQALSEAAKALCSSYLKK